ncbi:MAG TPA: hypothetical protein VM008_15585 [Phycisphaerae bacterium]|nr:hypothetical protein [Phycisphaerae bacterium]
MAGHPEIPKILTDADWQKEKGIVAKLSKGETGLGALMKKLDEEYKKVTWDKFDAFRALPYNNMRSIEAVDKAFNDAKAEYPKVESVRKAAFALRDRANAVAAEWGKSKIIPSSSVKHVVEIGKTCETFALSCKSMDMKSFEQMKQEIRANEAKAREMVKTWANSIRTGASAVNSDPNIKTYNDKLYQKVRGMGTAVSNIPELKVKWSPIWGNAGMSSDKWISDAVTPDKMKSKVKIILDQLTKLETEMKG